MKRGVYVLLPVLILAMVLFFGCANKHTTSGKIAFNAKNFDKAINDFKLAIQSNPNDPIAHFWLAKSYREKKDYLLMVQHLEKAESLDQKYKEEGDKFRIELWVSSFNDGNTKTNEEKFEEALMYFQTAIISLPQKYEAYVNAGYVWTRMNNDDSAFSYYAQAYKLAPNNKDAILNFARHSHKMGLIDKAELLYREFLVIDTTDAQVWFGLGAIAEDKKQYDSALYNFNRALALAQDDCTILFRVGIIYSRYFKNYESAESAFAKAVEFCPADLDAQINLCIILIEEKKFEDAVQRLKTITEENPKECTGWDLLSQSLLLKGDKKSADEAYKKYTECKSQ